MFNCLFTDHYPLRECPAIPCRYPNQISSSAQMLQPQRHVKCLVSLEHLPAERVKYADIERGGFSTAVLELEYPIG